MMADAEKTFYEVNDGAEIVSAIAYLMDHPNVPRIDLVLDSNDDGSKKEASVYWTGTVLRIDIKGLKQVHDDIIKINVVKDPSLTHLFFYESKDGGEHFMFNGQIACDHDIAAAILDAMHRGRGRWNLIVEKDVP